MKPLKLLIITTYLATSACITTQTKTTDKADVVPPKLLAPNVKKIWIPAIIKDDGQEWEEGHYLYRIERGTSWSR